MAVVSHDQNLNDLGKSAIIIVDTVVKFMFIIDQE